MQNMMLGAVRASRLALCSVISYAQRINGPMCKNSSEKDKKNNCGMRGYLRLVSSVFLVLQGNSELSSNAITLLMLLRLAYLGSYGTFLILKTE